MNDSSASNQCAKVASDTAGEQVAIRNGKVGVLVSNGYGAGWFSWNTNIPDCLYDPDIIHAIESGASKRYYVGDAKSRLGVIAT